MMKEPDRNLDFSKSLTESDLQFESQDKKLNLSGGKIPEEVVMYLNRAVAEVYYLTVKIENQKQSSELNKKFAKIEKNIGKILLELGYPWPPPKHDNALKPYRTLFEIATMLCANSPTLNDFCVPSNMNQKTNISQFSLPTILAITGVGAKNLAEATFESDIKELRGERHRVFYGTMYSAFCTLNQGAPDDLYQDGNLNPASKIVIWIRGCCSKIRENLQNTGMESGALKAFNDYFSPADIPARIREIRAEAKKAQDAAVT